MKQPRGYVVYKGLSRLGGSQPIVAVVTIHSENEKTGDMYQLWVLDQSAPPTEVARRGEDDSICGNCKFRPIKTVGTADPNCYVTLIHGPQQVWKAWRAGKYPMWPRRGVFERGLRMAAYGDPAALPLATIRALTDRCSKGWTGYTHQWKRFQGLRHFCMASVDTLEEMAQAQALGWRTFRTDPEKLGPQPGYPVRDQRHDITYTEPGEIGCPAAIEAGKRTTCDQCLLCNGMRPPSIAIPDLRKHIQIYIHG